MESHILSFLLELSDAVEFVAPSEEGTEDILWKSCFFLFGWGSSEAWER